MKAARKPLRLFEIVLWVLGITLLGAASGETFDRWHYQSEQERALAERAPAPLLPPSEDGAPAEPPPAASDATGATDATETTDASEATAPARSVIVEEEKPKARERKPAIDPAVLGRIEIPRLGMSAMVRKGEDERTLARAVGWIPGSAAPGQPGNIVLAGHRDTFFRRLEGIETNDRIVVTVPPDKYEYRVREVRIVEPHETSVLASRGVEELTLVTCYPFRFIGPAPDRFIVQADRVR